MDSAPAEHPPHGNVTSYKKSLRLSSDQIVSDMSVLCIGCFITLKKNSLKRNLKCISVERVGSCREFLIFFSSVVFF